jgi:putative membrane protein
MKWPHHRSALGLAVVYTALFIALAIRPYDRADWLLENLIAVVFVALLVATRNVFPLSRASYTLIFVFLCLHTVGAHYTYSRVPIADTIGSFFGWDRNHYDRFVHFAYGLLIAYPIRELFLRVAEARGFWGYFLPLDVTLSTSFVYELIEWAAATVFGGELGYHYLGTQGDVWDAHKDMALAGLGAVIALALIALVNSRLERDFARQWNESLRVKRRAPLGEDRLAELLDEDAR